MHNRLRMIAASFLTKDLLIDWRRGERYFERWLADADLAANNGGWQWAASTGTDAAPYFRIFNPVLQSKKFDPAGAFIAALLPELAALPAAYRHEPWNAPPLVLAEAGMPHRRDLSGADRGAPRGPRERALAVFSRRPWRERVNRRSPIRQVLDGSFFGDIIGGIPTALARVLDLV